jgi:hypothetical protein
VFRLVAVLLVLATAPTACAVDAEVDPLPEPPATVPATSTTTPKDYSGVPLAGVPGRTTTTLALGPGQAHLAGRVMGPEGPVPGATVRIQRLVGDSLVTTEVRSAANGTWRLDRIKGGRYRVRAWRAPDLTQGPPQVLFLGGPDDKVLNLVVQRKGGMFVSAGLSANPPPVGEPLSLVVGLRVRTVDSLGVVRTLPVANTEVTLAVSGIWRLLSPNPAPTDTTGRARWQLSCGAIGPQPLGIVVGAQTFPLSLSADAPAAARAGDHHVAAGGSRRR